MHHLVFNTSEASHTHPTPHSPRTIQSPHGIECTAPAPEQRSALSASRQQERWIGVSPPARTKPNKMIFVSNHFTLDTPTYNPARRAGSQTSGNTPCHRRQRTPLGLGPPLTTISPTQNDNSIHQSPFVTPSPSASLRLNPSRRPRSLANLLHPLSPAYHARRGARGSLSPAFPITAPRASRVCPCSPLPLPRHHVVDSSARNVLLAQDRRVHSSSSSTYACPIFSPSTSCVEPRPQLE